VKLLLDRNLSFRLVRQLADIFPGSFEQDAGAACIEIY